MKKMLTVLCLCAAMSSVTVLRAGELTFTPSISDMQDLDHDYVYAWKISPVSVPVGEQITSASLTFLSIDNSMEPENNDALYVRLLSSANITSAVQSGKLSRPYPSSHPNFYRGYDNETSGDALAAYGTQLTVYHDPDTSAHNYTYTFSDAALSTLAGLISTDHAFGIGFDPDCHYDNCGIQMKINTACTPSVPAPAPSCWWASGLPWSDGFVALVSSPPSSPDKNLGDIIPKTDTRDYPEGRRIARRPSSAMMRMPRSTMSGSEA